MYLQDLIFISISVLGSYAVGTILCKGGFFQSIFIGVLIQGLLLGVTIWFIPNLTKLLLMLMQLIAVIILSKKNKSIFRQHCIEIKEELYKPFIYISLIIAFVFSFPFSLYEYPFNSHDSVYWGYVYESLRADYIGNIRSPLFYPLTLPVTHVLPMMTLSTLLIYVPDSNLLSIISAKYVVTIIFFWRLGWFLLSAIGKRILGYGIIIFVSLIFIYESEIGYNLMVSSYIYEFILLEIAILLKNNKEDTLLLLILLITLISARASLALASIGALGFLLWHHKDKLKANVYVIMGLVTANILTWLILPKPLRASSNFLCNPVELTLVNPLFLDEIKKLSVISDWVLPSSITDNIFRFIDMISEKYQLDSSDLPYYIFGIFLIYVILKLFLPIMMWLKIDFVRGYEIKKGIRGALYIYLAILLIGMFILRIGGSPTHQFHGFLVLSVLSLIALFHLSINKLIVGYFIIALGIYSAMFDGLMSYPFSAILSQGIQKEHMHYTDSNTFTTSEQQRLWHDEIEYMAAGKLRLIAELNDYQYEGYFSGEPADVESIASLWINPTQSMKYECEK